jgi:hypothetical protein
VSEGFTAELAEQDDPEIGFELIRVRFDDGRVEELRLHDYERLYALPGVYEQIVSDRLGCRSPAVIAGMLAAAVDAAGRSRDAVRVIDIAAGNGISGEALAAEGLAPLLGTDIVPSARAAALRDRPGVYGEYLTLDLLTLSGDDRRHLVALACDALTCVAPVGHGPAQVPPAALAAAVGLLAPDALVAYMHQPAPGVDDPVTTAFWAAQLGDVAVDELERTPYLHRRTVNGHPFEMVGVVWRVRRRPAPLGGGRRDARGPAGGL